MNATYVRISSEALLVWAGFPLPDTPRHNVKPNLRQ